MKETLKIETERVDDIPLLLAHMQRMKIASLLDLHIPVHGNRKGLSFGNVVIVWLAHILSEGDHRMNHVQGWSKRRLELIRGIGLSSFDSSDLGQLKIALASLDPLGMPLATEVLSGESADDPVYEPIIARVRDGLKKTGLLYIGDCKMAALQTRASIQYYGDYYLCPLPAVQVPSDQLREEVDKLKAQGTPLIKVERVNDKGESVCIAQGYEISLNLTAEVNGQTETWTERRLLIQSTSGAEAAKHALLERLDKPEKAIQNIIVRKQGKQRVTNRIEIDQAIQKIGERFRVEGLLINSINEEIYEKPVRAYRGKLPEVRQEVTYTIKTERNEEALAYSIHHLSCGVN